MGIFFISGANIMNKSDVKTIAIAVGIAAVLYFFSKQSTAAPVSTANADMGGPNFGANDPSTW
jgi:hypothetical protein